MVTHESCREMFVDTLHFNLVSCQGLLYPFPGQLTLCLAFQMDPRVEPAPGARCSPCGGEIHPELSERDQSSLVSFCRLCQLEPAVCGDCAQDGVCVGSTAGVLALSEDGVLGCVQAAGSSLHPCIRKCLASECH